MSSPDLEVSEFTLQLRPWDHKSLRLRQLILAWGAEVGEFGRLLSIFAVFRVLSKVQLLDAFAPAQSPGRVTSDHHLLFIIHVCLSSISKHCFCITCTTCHYHKHSSLRWSLCIIPSTHSLVVLHLALHEKQSNLSPKPFLLRTTVVYISTCRKLPQQRPPVTNTWHTSEQEVKELSARFSGTATEK